MGIGYVDLESERMLEKNRNNKKVNMDNEENYY